MTISKNNPHILFLFSDTGGGHRSAAEAIIEALNLDFPAQFTYEMVDFFLDYSPPPLNLAGPTYPAMSRMDYLWGRAFETSDDPDHMRVIYAMLWPYIRLYMYKLHREHPCDVIVSVHPLINTPFLRAKRKKRDSTPYVTVVTDLVSTHTAWFNNQANLIIVPTSVLPNWEREAQKFVPDMKCLVIYGARRENLFKKIESSELIITTYALLRRDLDELLKFEFNAVILDEAQNIKNPNTITARSVRKMQARFRLCLSGTPIENTLLELWSLFEFLMPGFLGSQASFQKGFVKPIKDGDEDSLGYLKARVKPFILRRTKNAVAKDLPPKVENIYYSALLDDQRALYAALAKKLRDQVLQDVDEKGIGQSQISILDALLKLRQICCHPRLLKLDMPGFNANLSSGKFEAFKDLVTTIIDDGHKVLVFSQFVQMLHIIRNWLHMVEIPFCYLDGTSKDRFDQVDKFNNTPEIPIFLISLKAGGTGLNLTSADYVIHYDPWWNPAVEDQATDRTHRIGQTRQVFAYKMICENTVEEKILKLQESKKGIADSIIPGHSAWKSLTRSDLEMLFEI